MKKTVILFLLVFTTVTVIMAILFVCSPKTQLKYGIIKSTEVTNCMATYEQDVLSLDCKLKTSERSLETVCNINDILNENSDFEALRKIKKIKLYVVEDGYTWPLISAVYVRENDKFVIEQITFFKVVDSSEFIGLDLSNVKTIRISRSISISNPNDFANFPSLEQLKINMSYSNFDSGDIDEIRELLPNCFFFFTDETLAPKL